MIIRLASTFVFLVAASLATFAQEASPVPEAASGYASKALVEAKRHMIVAAHPLAAEAGREILRAGGSATDAAIAVQLVLGLVEPQSSGLGGGSFLVHWDEATKELRTYDGRETAPAAAKPERFLVNGDVMKFPEAVRSGLSVGTPGTVKLLQRAHEKHGKLPWARLFDPAIKLARDGFPMPARLHVLLFSERPENFAEGARRYFYDEEDRPRLPGSIVKNPDYANTLEAIASGGARAFYEGSIAEAIVTAVGSAPIAKGDLTLEDLKNYDVVEREPVCFAYRARKICGMGPPSSGTLAVGQTLKLLEPFGDIRGRLARMSPQALHLIAEAEKLAFADRNRYVADPAFVPQPSGFLDDAYLDERRKLISRSRAALSPEAGSPPGLTRKTQGVDATQERPGTSQISIIDDSGNAVSMTTTIESAFGSHLWAAGFLLNNELTDFSLPPADAAGTPIANRVEGGKRPRSSMAPLIVFGEDGRLEMVTGSPGGSRIILFCVKALIALIDWELAPDEAAALANFGSEGGAFLIEPGPRTYWPAEVLKTYGHILNATAMTSGIHTIVKRRDGLLGGADPRREGVALGD